VITFEAVSCFTTARSVASRRGFQARRLTVGRWFQLGRTLGYQLSQCVNFWIGSRYAGLKSSPCGYAIGDWMLAGLMDQLDEMYPSRRPRRAVP